MGSHHYDRQIQAIKARYSLEEAEIHTAWLLRDYREQATIPDFDSLSYPERRSAVRKARHAKLLSYQKKNKSSRQLRKNFAHTESYAHLTRAERRNFVYEVADCIAGWSSARLFAECVDKLYFDPSLHPSTVGSVDELAFDQVVSRCENFLNITSGEQQNYGLLIHDNNDTAEKKYTEMMKSFYKEGTLWTKIHSIIETPLFVDSTLTNMVQAADLCAYALRRYIENDEAKLFSSVFRRADRKDGVVVGIRHFTNHQCSCRICAAHRQHRRLRAL